MKLLNVFRYKLSLLITKATRLRYRLLGVDIGKEVFISKGAFIDTAYRGSISIDDKSFIMRGSMIVAHDPSIYKLTDFASDNGRGFVRIGKNVTIGMGAIVLRNVTIGENAIVGAGAVVTKNVPANTIVAGNPAQIIMKFEPVDNG